MTWVKAEIGENVNEAIEALQDEEGCNKTKATELLLAYGLQRWLRETGRSPEDFNDG